MSSIGEHHNSNWSQAMYYRRKYEEHMSRQRAEKAKEQGDVIEVDYVVIAPSSTENPKT